MPRASGAWPGKCMRADFGLGEGEGLPHPHYSAIKNQQSPDGFFDRPPNLFAPPAGCGRVGYDAFRVERLLNPLKVFPPLVIRELIGFRGNYYAGLRMS